MRDKQLGRSFLCLHASNLISAPLISVPVRNISLMLCCQHHSSATQTCPSSPPQRIVRAPTPSWGSPSVTRTYRASQYLRTHHPRSQHPDSRAAPLRRVLYHLRRIGAPPSLSVSPSPSEQQTRRTARPRPRAPPSPTSKYAHPAKRFSALTQNSHRNRHRCHHWLTSRFHMRSHSLLVRSSACQGCRAQARTVEA